MANKRDLKKDINYVLGDIIGVVIEWELENPDKDTKKSQTIIEDVIVVFDDLIAKVNNREPDDMKAHFKSIRQELEDKGRELIDKINKL
jgi:hypothetical protein